MTVPVIILGSGGILYYQNVIKHNIWDDNLAQAKAISALTTNYVNLSENYLRSLAVRPLVISAIEGYNSSFLNTTADYAAHESIQFDSIFITDSSGKVLSYRSMYPDDPYPRETGKNYIDRPYVSQVLDTSRPYVSDAIKDPIRGSGTVFVSVPILDVNDTMIGVLGGSLDLMNYTKIIVGTQVKNQQYIFLVNGTGHVMVHGNMSYMKNMTDFSMLPAVQNVINDREGVVEQMFPFEGNVRLASYSPVKNYGWGVVVSLPVDIAYAPVSQFVWYVVGILLLLLFLSAILSILLGNYITDPLLRLSSAMKGVPKVEPGKLERELPLKRKDEIGGLARAFLEMANLIKADRADIIAARDQAEASRALIEKEKERTEDEKIRAELYLDILAHDINNLNQMTIMNLELIKDDPGLTAEEKESIDMSLNATRSSASIIDNVRVLQHITESKPAPELVDLNGMILECIKEISNPDGKKVTINYSPWKDLLVNGTPLLKEVFCNLLNNSVKYSNDEVTIDILPGETLIQGKKYYQVIVADNGHGIPDEVKPRLFSRFQRGTTKARGKGLGLYIVRTLLERYDGSVKLEDRVTGDYSKGSKFTITLPAAGEGKHE